MNPVRITLPPSLSTVAESEEFEGVFALDVLKAGPDLYSFQEPLRWEVTVSNTGDALLAMGTVEGCATTSCARCLDSFELDLFGEVEAFYLFSEECAMAEELDEDEYELLDESHVIDLAPHLLAALRLELPLVPLCDDDCAGLCETCGANLNHEACSCPAREEEPEQNDVPGGADNPFAVLKGYEF